MHIKSQEYVICAGFLSGLTSRRYVQQVKQESHFLPRSLVPLVCALALLLSLAHWHHRTSWVILLDARLHSWFLSLSKTLSHQA